MVTRRLALLLVAGVAATACADDPEGRGSEWLAHGGVTFDFAQISAALEMALDSYFFNRWEAVQAYFFPEGFDARYLKAYANASTRAVAVFNFWERGETFFTLRLGGLEDGNYRVVDEDGVLFAKNADVASFSAKDLSAGVRLAVPAARTKVFEVVPEKADLVTVKRKVTQAQVDACFAERRPALAAAADEDYRMRDAQAMKVVDGKAEL